MKKMKCVAALLLAVLLMQMAAVTVTATEAQPLTASAFELRVLELVNIERANQGLQPLQWCNFLAAAAREHSEDMALHNFLSHTGSDGSAFWERFTRIGIFYNREAENVARGQTTPEAVMTSWMNSAGHRANIMDPNLTHIGVGLAQTNDTFRFYWTQKFGGGTRIVTTHFASLQAALNAANLLTQSQFTPESWDALTRACTAAQAVRDNPSATQREVDNATLALETAIGNLTRVDMYNVVLLLRYLAGHDVTVDHLNAYVNDDGVIAMEVVVLLLQKINAVH